jgi:2-polyprenyl-3-methyl-5-hydroxy-6-metoxy-1,4-benzoquinol methylase
MTAERESPAHQAACPLCQSRSLESVESHLDDLSGQRYEIYRCGACRLEFAWPFQGGTKEWYQIMCDGSDVPYTEQDLLDRHAEFFKLVVPGKTVLDVGCGNGRFVYELQQRGFEAEGVDFDDYLVERAQKHGLKGIRAVDLRRLSLGEIPIDKKYDIITASEFIEHIEFLDAFLKFVHDSLKPGGHFFLTTPNRDRPASPFREWFDFPPHHITRWNCQTLNEMFEKRGFDVVSCRSTQLPLGYVFNTLFYPITKDQMIKRLNRMFLGRVMYRSLPQEGTAGDESPTGEKAYSLLRRMKLSKIVSRLLGGFERLAYVLSLPVLLAARAYWKATNKEHGIMIVALYRKR